MTVVSRGILIYLKEDSNSTKEGGLHPFNGLIEEDIDLRGH